MSPRTLNPCGTRAGYYRHIAAGEPIDPACQTANTDYQRARRRTAGIRPYSEANPRPPCGTAGGYAAHRYRGEPYCPECRAANTAACRAYREHGTKAPR